MLQRVERAILGLGGIGRVHIHRWGDGSAHLHWWLIARPEGMLQLRGALLPMWNRLIPPLAEDAWRAGLTAIAASMAEGGGRAMC